MQCGINLNVDEIDEIVARVADGDYSDPDTEAAFNAIVQAMFTGHKHIYLECAKWTADPVTGATNLHTILRTLGVSYAAIDCSDELFEGLRSDKIIKDAKIAVALRFGEKTSEYFPGLHFAHAVLGAFGQYSRELAFEALMQQPAGNA